MGAFQNVLGTIGINIASAFDSSGVDDLDKKIDALDKSLDDLDKDLEDLGGSKGAEPVANLTSAFGQLAGGVAGLAGAAKIFDFGTSAYETANQVDHLKESITRLNGDTEETTNLLDSLNELEASSPFEFEELAPAAQRMLQLGSNADTVKTSLGALTDWGAAMHATPGAIDAASEALARMDQAGQATSRGMQGLVAQGIPAWEMLAKTLNTDVQGAMDAVEKGTVDAQTAIGAVTTGLTKEFGGAAKEFTASWEGQMDQFAKSQDQIMENIGRSIKSMLNDTVLPVLQKVNEALMWLGDAWNNMPAGVQTAILTIGGLAAAFAGILGAIASVQGAIALLAPAFGTITAGLGGVAAAVGLTIGPLLAIVAALGLLGAWVYANWDPIVATLTQAWDGLAEAWGAAWGIVSGALTAAWETIAGVVTAVWEPIGAFFSTIWTAIAPYFTAVWDGIAGALTGIWNAIKATAATVWNGIVAVFQTFLEWAAKIPGANKLINLDDAWKSAEKLKSETDKATGAVKGFHGAAKDAAGSASAPVPKLKKAIEDTGKAAKKTTDEVKPLVFHNAELEASTKLLEATYKKANEEIVKAKQKLKELGDDLPTMIQSTDAFNESMKGVIASSVTLSQTSIPGLNTSLDLIKGTTNDLGGAFAALGIKSTTEFNTVAANAKIAYDVVAGSNLATDYEKNNALVKMLEAQRAAAIANTGIIPTEIDKQLAEVKKKLEDPSKGVPALESPWKTMTTNVSTVFTNFAQDIGKSLFDGDLSFGEKVKGMLTSLGEAVTSAFIEPAAAAIGKFISGAIADLLGEAGLGGIFDSLTKIGTKSAEVFADKATDVAADVPSGGIPSVPGGGGGGGGGAGSFLSGGLFGNILSGAQLGMSVFQSFQFAAMNKTLDLIENYTRYLKIGLVEQSDSLLNDSHKIRNFLAGQEQNYWGTTVPSFVDIMGKLDNLGHIQGLEFKLIDIHDRFLTALDRLLEISSNTYWTMTASQDNTAALWAIRDAVVGKAPAQVTINVDGGSSPTSTASAVALKLQGAMI